MLFKELKQKYADYVVSDEIMKICFDLVFGLENTKEIKILNEVDSDIALEGFISFMQARDFSGERFSAEIESFIIELDRLYSLGKNDCKPALVKFVKALDEDCCKRGEKASIESVIKIHTALLSVGIVEIGKAETEKASNVLTIVAILTNILIFFTRSGL